VLVSAAVEVIKGARAKLLKAQTADDVAKALSKARTRAPVPH
jgi:hypothetical protein